MKEKEISADEKFFVWLVATMFFCALWLCEKYDRLVAWLEEVENEN